MQDNLLGADLCCAVLAVADDTRITATQYRVFALIAKGYRKRADMAEKTGKTVVTIARAIDALLKLRLIERETVPGKPSKLRVAGNIIAAARIISDAPARIADEASITHDTPSRITHDTTRISDTAQAVDKPEPACISTRAGAETLISKTTEDQIRSDQIPVSKERIDSLIARAGSDCNPTASGLHHGADLNRLLRAGCDWIDDILPAVDKLAASFRRRGKRFATWELLTEHAIDFRNRRVAGLPPPSAPTPFARREPPRNGVRRNLHLEAIACARA